MLINNAIRASMPAIVARDTVTKNGSKSKTAIRVAGNDPLNIMTPIKPFSKPLDDFVTSVFMLIVR